MKHMRYLGHLLPCWLLFASFAAIACGAPLFEEDWNSGRIDPAKWDASVGNGVMHVEPIGGGDHALMMAGRLDWTAYIYSVGSFSRGDHLRVTFKLWGDERRVSPDGVALFPDSAGITGPWHGSNKGPIYSTIDEAIDMWWAILRLGENGVYQKGPLLSQAFMRALAAARSKSNALMVRVECGDERGGLFQWSTNGGRTWIDEFNTIGVAGGSASPLFLGFAPGQSHVYIDDIVVDQGADDRSPEPTPKPKPLPARIEDLSEHFSKPSGDISPWMLVPDQNVREASTTEHPGMITIYQNGLGQDIKGILGQPIRFDQYRVPWEFQLGMVQSFDAMLAAGSKTQANTAIGLNVARGPRPAPARHA